VEVPALLAGAAGAQHELERAVEHNLVAVADTAQQRDPATVVFAEIGLHPNGLIRILGITAEDDGRQAIALDSREGENLYLYSMFHPAHGAAQARVPRTSARFDRVKRISSLRRGELGPGQLLYVPPYFFHSSRKLAPSVSLRMFVPSKEDSVVRKLISFGPPVNPDWADFIQFSAG